MRIIWIVIPASVYRRSCTATPRDAYPGVELPYATQGCDFTMIHQDDSAMDLSWLNDSDIDLSWLNDLPAPQYEDTKQTFDVENLLELCFNNDDSVVSSSSKGRSPDRKDSLESPNRQMSSSPSRNVDSSFGINQPPEFSDNAPVQPLSCGNRKALNCDGSVVKKAKSMGSCRPCRKKTGKEIPLHGDVSDKHHNKKAALLPFQCSQCGLTCESSLALSTHVGRTHKDAVREEVGNSGGIDRLAKHCCGECKKSYTAARWLRKHIRTHHPDKEAALLPFQCDQCGLPCKSSRAVSTHVGMAHKKNVVNSGGSTRPAKHCCAVCKKTFTKSKRLTEHIRQKHADEIETLLPLQCTSCEARYESEHRLSIHIGQAHKKKVVNSGGIDRSAKHCCEVCKQRFTKAKRLSNHIHDNHPDEVETLLPFQCTLCETRYESQKSLSIHIGKVHRDAMSKEKMAFPCRHCDRQFATSSNRSRHINRAHPEVPHKNDKPDIVRSPACHFTSVNKGIWRCTASRDVMPTDRRSYQRSRTMTNCQLVNGRCKFT